MTFFGGRTRMPAGPALLALRTGAPLYVASCGTKRMPPEPAVGPAGGRPESGPLDERVRLLTQRIADELAAGIAGTRQDWHMLQRMWLDETACPGRSAVADRRAGVAG